MGKKDKRVDKSKVDAKKERKASKQEKLSKKRVKKEINQDNNGKTGKVVKEQDIEAILAEFAAKEKTRTAVIVRNIYMSIRIYHIYCLRNID